MRIADNFGNLKTGFRVKDEIIQDIPSGESVFVKINGRIGVARTASKLQDGLDGKLLLAMGSSIHDLNDLSNHQMDLYVKGVATGDNATLRFFPQFTNISPHDLAPVAGTKIEIAQVKGSVGKQVAKVVEFSKVLPAWVVEPFIGGWRTE